MAEPQRDGIAAFVSTVQAMLSRPDFLIPLVAAQKQFRDDNYQMGSSALLEDLFFDAVGTFIAENAPAESFRRRVGREPWDYEFFGEPLSHKENTSLTFTAFWGPGVKTDGAGWVPRFETYDFDQPIVLVYSGSRLDYRWSSLDLQALMGTKAIPIGGISPLGVRAISKSPLPGSALLLAHRERGVLGVENLWLPGEWEDLTFIDLWPTLGGRELLDRDLWLVRNSQHLEAVERAPLPQPLRLVLAEDHLPTGVYVLAKEDLTNVPLVANNKAHSVGPEFTAKVMAKARAEGRFVPMPLWFAAFADTTPPNLYSAQRRQYEALFAARQRPGPAVG